MDERNPVIDALIEARQAAGLTQAQVAERMGVTQSRVSKIEKSNGFTTFMSVLGYADAVGATVQLVRPV